jgi:signal transduction histidine kinase
MGVSGNNKRLILAIGAIVLFIGLLNSYSFVYRMARVHSVDPSELHLSNQLITLRMQVFRYFLAQEAGNLPLAELRTKAHIQKTLEGIDRENLGKLGMDLTKWSTAKKEVEDLLKDASSVNPQQRIGSVFRVDRLLADLQKDIREVETIQRSEAGETELWLRAQAILLVLSLFIVVFFYLKERTNTEKQLIQAHASKERALVDLENAVSREKELERRKKEIVAVVAHDLRTPLTSIRNNMEMLIMGVYGAVSERALEMAKMTNRSLTRLINLVNELLDVEKLETGTIQITPRVLSLPGIFERSIEALTGFAEQKGTRIISTCTATSVLADPDRLTQVIDNLLSNAIKFSPEGETISVKGFDIPGWTEIQIEDHGPGVPPENRSTIFLPFQQLPQQMGEMKGTGLGLAISKAIIAGHKGLMGIDDAKPTGAIFWLRLPSVESIDEQQSSLDNTEPTQSRGKEPVRFSKSA